MQSLNTLPKPSVPATQVTQATQATASIPLRDWLANAAPCRLCDLPPEATFATVGYCSQAGDMPELSEAVAIFATVPAIFVEVPVEAVKQAFMQTPEISSSFATFEDYHAWYTSYGDTPRYERENRWPCIASVQADEVVEDGNHRLHAYVRAGHPTIPVLRYDAKSWWKAHERWLTEKDTQTLASRSLDAFTEMSSLSEECSGLSDPAAPIHLGNTLFRPR